MSETDKEAKRRQHRIFPTLQKYSPKELKTEFGIQLPKRSEYMRMWTLQEAEELLKSLPPKARRTAKAKARPTSKHPCDGCSLKGCKQVLGEGNLNEAKVVFVGEAPGQDEEKKGVPFVGRAGQLLRKILAGLEFSPNDYYITNVLRCRPFDNRTPTKHEISRCTKYLKAELAGFNGLIVCLGATAVKALLSRSGIHNNRGYGFYKDSQRFFATYHPAFILWDKSKNDYEKVLRKDLKKVKNFIDFQPKIRYNSIRDDKALDRFISTSNQQIDKNFKMTFDIETNGANIHSSDIEVLTIAFSFGAKKDENWMLPLEHPKSPFKGRTSEVMQKLAPFFKSKKVKSVGHGGKYDIQVLNKCYGIETLNYFFDTMIAHFLLEGKSHVHKLKSLAWKYTKYGGYDVDVSDLSKVSLQEVGDYNMLDAFVTRKLMRVFSKKLTKKQRALLTDTLCSSEGALAEIENEGMLIDEETRQALESDYVEKLSEIETKMHGYPEIVEMEAERGAILNFNSSNQLRDLFLRIDAHPTRKTKKRRDVSTDKKAIEEVKSKHPVLKDLLTFRTKEKILNTYLLPYKKLGERIHGDYSSITAATGRLACSKPNLQNIPYLVRPVFISGLGWLVEMDYSQLELRVLAMYSKDEVLVSSFLDGIDIHENTRVKIFGDNSKASKLEQTRQRVAAKTVNFGIAYGVTSKGLRENLAEDGVNVSQKRAGEMIDIFYQTYPKVAEWQEEVWNQVKAQGYYETFFGRTRKFSPGQAKNKAQLAKIRREAINTPIQGTASDLVRTATGTLWKKMRHKKMRAKMIAHVHDEIMFDVPEKELEYLIRTAPPLMESFDFDWINVPIKVDIKLGTAWGKLEEF